MVLEKKHRDVRVGLSVEGHRILLLARVSTSAERRQMSVHRDQDLRNSPGPSTSTAKASFFILLSFSESPKDWYRNKNEARRPGPFYFGMMAPGSSAPIHFKYAGWGVLNCLPTEAEPVSGPAMPPPRCLTVTFLKMAPKELVPLTTRGVQQGLKLGRLDIMYFLGNDHDGHQDKRGLDYFFVIWVSFVVEAAVINFLAAMRRVRADVGLHHPRGGEITQTTTLSTRQQLAERPSSSTQTMPQKERK